MMKLSNYISKALPEIVDLRPWEATGQSETIVSSLIHQLSNEFILLDGNAIHKTATIESGAILKPPCVIGPNCFVASYAYLRGGVWIDDNVIIGPSCEIKSSFIHGGSKAAHFNFIGDSVIGRDVNIEAGAIVANYRNELENKEIICVIDGKKVGTAIQKFGSLIGDECKIGANAVLAPGSILQPGTIVKRLALIDQTQAPPVN